MVKLRVAPSSVPFGWLVVTEPDARARPRATDPWSRAWPDRSGRGWRASARRRSTPGRRPIWLICWASLVSALSSTWCQRQGVGGHRQDHDRRVGRVDLAVGRRRRQVARQLPSGGVDRGLDVVGGGVDVAVEIELQRDRWSIRAPLVDVICETPGICANCRSSGCATDEAIVSGLAPGSDAETWMVGKSTCGSGATGSSGDATSRTGCRS